ncbi:MAG: membrane protein insertion efficiency factor YidD [Clostridia bacterium]|nr:membrane protein insertion efficiency factor YidD [Clostridia bacterium]
MKKFFNIFLKVLLFPFTIIIYILIYFYKYCISPLLPNVCKFTPTCSTYFLLAVKDYGVIKGSFLGVKRLLRCNPWSKGGLDPLKPNIKGKIKWIL